MANDFYVHGTAPQTNSDVRSYTFRNEFDQITTAFNKLPALVLANGGKALVVNPSGTAVDLTVGTLALEGNLTTTGAFNTTFVQQSAAADVLLPASSFQLYTNTEFKKLAGLVLSNGPVDTANDITVDPGGATVWRTIQRDDQYVVLTSAITKQLDATWVAGTNQGGMAAGVTLSTTASYAVFLLLLTDGSVDAGFDNTATGTNLLAMSTVSKVRRIGVIKRFNGSITPFKQVGNYFYKTNTLGASFVRTNTLDFSFNDSRSPMGPGIESIDNIPIIVMLKMWIFNTTPPGGTVYFRARYNTNNDPAVEANSQTAYDAASGERSNAVNVLVPWKKGVFTSDGVCLRFGTASATNTYALWFKGFIDFRE